MAENDVQVRVGGDVKDLQKAANQATKELDKIASAQKKAGKASDTLSSKATQAGAALSRSKDSTRQAQFALTNLNRVVQDAPFGFIAIQNNIDPLIQSFLSLKSTTGSAGGAFKALLSSFKGPAGILTLVSLASTAVLAFGDKLAEAFNKGKKAAEEARKALKEAFDQLLQIDKTGGRQFTFATRGELINAIEGANAALNIFKNQAKDAALEVQKIVDGGEEVDNVQSRALSTAQIQLQIAKENVLAQQETIDGLKAELIEWDLIEKQAANLNSLGAIRTDQLEDQVDAAKDQRIETEETLNAVRQIAAEAVRAAPAPTVRVPLQAGPIAPEQLRQPSEQPQEIDLLRQRQQAFQALNEQISVGEAAFIDFGAAGAAALADIALGFESLKSLGEIVKSILAGLVKQLIAAAAKAAILNFLLPGSGQLAGGFGGLFKSFLGFRPFATGGIVTRPTPAIIGEAGPEAVIPLNQLRGVGTQKLEIVGFRMAGGDMLFSLQDAQGTRGVGGVNIS